MVVGQFDSAPSSSSKHTHMKMVSSSSSKVNDLKLFFTDSATPSQIWDYISQIIDVPPMIEPNDKVIIGEDDIVIMTDDEYIEIDIKPVSPIF
jgi:hypothetical protein